MCMPTCKAVLAGLCLLALTGCSSGVSVTATDRMDIRVGGTNLTMAAPAGLCFDPRSTDRNRSGVTFLFADCALTDAAPSQSLSLKGVVTAHVSNDGLPGTLEDLGDFLTSEGGLALLGSAKVLDRRISNNALLIKTEGQAPGGLPGASTIMWRSFSDLKGKLFTLSYIGFRGARLGDEAAISLLHSITDTIRAANAEAAPDA